MPSHGSGSLRLVAGTAAALLLVLALVLTGARLMVTSDGEPGPLVAPFLTAEPMRVTTVEPPEGETGVSIPGVLAIRDVHASTAGWTLLDATGGTVGFVAADGATAPPVGRAGDGPGELASPAHAARSGSRVAVLDVAGTRLDLLRTDSTAPERLTLASPDCPATLARDLLPYGEGWLVARRCVAGPASSVEVLLVGADLTVRPLVRRPLGDGRTLDPLLVAILVGTGEDAYLGSTRQPCLERVAGGGPARLCMTNLPLRPLPDELRRAFAERLGARAERVGMEFELPTSLPAFADLRPLADGRWAVRRFDGDGAERWVLERLDADRLRLRPASGLRIEPGPAGLLLLRDEPAGIRAWVVPAPAHPTR